MAVNINGDTGIDKVQPGSVDGVDLSDGSVSSPKLDTNIAVTGTLSAGGNISTPTGTVTASSFSGDGSSLTGIAGGFSNMDVFTSPGTWTNPGNVQKVKVTVTGGGGGAAGRGRSSGAGGGTAIEVIPFPSATNVPVTVGPGGSGATPNVQNGATAGGTSSFGAYCSATGGAGGDYEPQHGQPGGIGSGGQLNIAGQAGGTGPGQPGGNSFFGGGGAGRAEPPQGPGEAGRNYGGGGGTGAYSTNGGNGAAGVVVVEY